MITPASSTSVAEPAARPSHYVFSWLLLKARASATCGACRSNALAVIRDHGIFFEWAAGRSPICLTVGRGLSIAGIDSFEDSLGCRAQVAQLGGGERVDHQLADLGRVRWR